MARASGENGESELSLVVKTLSLSASFLSKPSGRHAGNPVYEARRKEREKARIARREADASKVAALAIEVFRRLDTNGDGGISFPELRQGLMKAAPDSWGDPRKVRLLLKAMDTNGDGRIQYEELLVWLASEGDHWDGLRHNPLFRHSGKFAITLYNEGTLTDFYNIDNNKKLGEGSFGSVCEGVHQKTGAARAIKSVLKTGMDESELETEMEVMSKLDHPHILKLYEVFSDFLCVYLVMELCTGGPLFDRIVEEHNFSEKQAAVVMQQIASGIHYMHLKLVCHRDIKPENFLLARPGSIDKCEIKIIDFGTARRFRQGQILTTRVGSPFYVAPEVLKGLYDQSCDVWSIGVIMYILLSGSPPFPGDSIEEIMESVVAGKYDFSDPGWDHVSEDAKDLIRAMLQYEPSARCAAGRIVDHTWIKDHAPAAIDRPLQASQLGSMRNFSKQNKFKKAALEVIAKGLQDEQIQQLKDMFTSLDKNGDGTVTLQELKDGIDQLEVPVVLDNLEEIFASIDVDGGGSIDYTEFIAATLDKKHYEEEATCWAAFQSFDKDGNGTIDKKELALVLENDSMEALVGTAGLEKIMKECDEDGDGQISFQEFMAMMTGRGQRSRPSLARPSLPNLPSRTGGIVAAAGAPAETN